VTDPPGRPGISRIPINPLVGGLPADAEAPRQVGHVEHATLKVRDELHPLIHE